MADETETVETHDEDEVTAEDTIAAIDELRATLDRVETICSHDNPSAKQKRLARALTKFVKFEADEVSECVIEQFHTTRATNGEKRGPGRPKGS